MASGLLPLNYDASALDGETFVVADGVNTVTYEFDSDGVFVDLNLDLSPDNRLIVITGSETHLELAALITAADRRHPRHRGPVNGNRAARPG